MDKNLKSIGSVGRRINIRGTKVTKYKYKKYGQFPLQMSCELTPRAVSQKRKTKVSPWRVHCMYCGMPTGTSQAEITSNSENIKPVALPVIELHLSEGISQSVIQQKFHQIIFFYSIEICLKGLGSLCRHFWTKPILSSCHEGKVRLI